jgi:hypothetical protein
MGEDVNRKAKVPQTPEEIAAARIYLRAAFTQAVDNFDQYLQSTDFVEGKELAVAARHITEEQYDREIAEGRQELEKGAAEVAAGTAEGEKILDRFIESWRIMDRLPAFFAPN